MTRYTVDHRSHPEGLRDELLDAGIPVALVMRDPEDETRTIVDVPDEYRDAAEAIVLAHDAASYEQSEAAERTQFEQDVAGLKAYQSLASPTAAQTALATKAQNRMLRRIFVELRDD